MIINKFVETLPHCNDFDLVYVLWKRDMVILNQEIGCLTVSWKLSKILLPYLASDF